MILSHAICYALPMRLFSAAAAAFTAERLAALRSAVPSTNNHIHMNAAGASPSTAAVINAITSHLHLETAEGGYAAAAQAADVTEEVYKSVTRLISASSPKEIALHDSSTTSFTFGIHSVPLHNSSIFVSASSTEYASNSIAMLKHSASCGTPPPRFLLNTPEGLDLKRLYDVIVDGPHEVSAVVLTHAPTNGGVVNDAVALGKMLRDLPPNVTRPLYLVDACQSIGQLEINVQEIGCDILAGTSRKWLRGPRGVGFMYVRQEAMSRLLEPHMLDLHGATWTTEMDYDVDATARRYEFWESSVANRLGFGAAVDLALEIGVPNIQERVRMLSDMMREGVEKEAGYKCMDMKGGGITPRSGICSFDPSPMSADFVVSEMQKRGISISASGRTSTLIDANARGLQKLIRVSPHYFNTEEEVKETIDALKSIREQYFSS